MHSETKALFDAAPIKDPPGRGMQAGDSVAGGKAPLSPLLRSAMHREPTAFDTSLDRTGAWQWTRPDVVATDPGAPFAFRSEMHVPNNTLSRNELERALEEFDRALDRQQILDGVWARGESPTTRTIDMHVLKLRRKIEPDPERPAHLLTVHGVGYKFVREPDLGGG